MRNIEQAIEILNLVDEEADFPPDNAVYAGALEAAGLLMPDLPEPGPYGEQSDYAEKEQSS